jgi:hypothetical protein
MIFSTERPRSVLLFLFGLLLGYRVLEVPALELKLGRREEPALEFPGVRGLGILEPVFGDRLGKIGFFLGSADEERVRGLMD